MLSIPPSINLCVSVKPHRYSLHLRPSFFPLAVSTFFSSSLSSCPLLSPPCSNGLRHPDPGARPIGRLMTNTTAVLMRSDRHRMGVALCFWSVLVTLSSGIKWITEHPVVLLSGTWLHNLKPIVPPYVTRPQRKKVHFSKGHLLQKLYSSKDILKCELNVIFRTIFVSTQEMLSGHPRCRWVWFFTNGSSAVNGCHQYESSNRW